MLWLYGEKWFEASTCPRHASHPEGKAQYMANKMVQCMATDLVHLQSIRLLSQGTCLCSNLCRLLCSTLRSEHVVEPTPVALVPLYEWEKLLHCTSASWQA